MVGNLLAFGVYGISCNNDATKGFVYVILVLLGTPGRDWMDSSAAKHRKSVMSVGGKWGSWACVCRRDSHSV